MYIRVLQLTSNCCSSLPIVAVISCLLKHPDGLFAKSRSWCCSCCKLDTLEAEERLLPEIAEPIEACKCDPPFLFVVSRCRSLAIRFAVSCVRIAVVCSRWNEVPLHRQIHDSPAAWNPKDPGGPSLVAVRSAGFQGEDNRESEDPARQQDIRARLR